MKKLILFFVIILVIFGCFTGCDSNKQKDDPIKTISTDKIGQENEFIEKDMDQQNNVSPTSIPADKKGTDSIEKVDTGSLNIMQKDTFVYINENGQLMIKSINDQIEKPIISDGYVCEYDFNFKDNKILYVIGRNDNPANTENILFDRYTTIIYDMNTKNREIINNNPVKHIGWSPSGKYIAVTEGMGPGAGRTKIYDVKDKIWLKVPSENENWFPTIDFKWSPSEDNLALIMLVHPAIPSPVGDGESFSISAYWPEKKNLIKSIVDGSSDYGFQKMQWIDNKTLIITKSIYKEPYGSVFYKANIYDDNLKEISEYEADPLSKQIPKEAYYYESSLSSDGKLLLYAFRGDANPRERIYLWDIDRQTKDIVSYGRSPKWMVIK